MDKNRKTEWKSEDTGQATDRKFSLLARKVRRRRIIVTAVLVIFVIFATVCAVNYREAAVSVKPPVVFSRTSVDNGQTCTTVYYSLGFKQVVYESEYGRNYCQRLWLWEDVEENPDVLTAEQYRQMVQQLDKRDQTSADYANYFKVFRTFDATILDVDQEKNHYTVYMKGAPYHFFEYEDKVYENADGAPESRYEGVEQQPMIVTAVWDGKTFKIEQVKDFSTGDAGSAAIYENFPKPVAIRLNTSIEGQEDWGQNAIERSRMKAAAHFGKVLAEDTYLFLDDENAVLQLYRIVPDKWEADCETGPQDNDVLLEEKPLKELKERT